MSRYGCVVLWPWYGVGLCLVHSHEGKDTHSMGMPSLERSICGQNGKKLEKIAKIRKKYRENRGPGIGARTYGLGMGSDFVWYAPMKVRIPILWVCPLRTINMWSKR